MTEKKDSYKYVYCDHTVEVGPAGATEQFGFAAFVTYLAEGERFTRNASGLRAGMRLLDAVESHEDGAPFRFDSEAWAMLRDEAENPSVRVGPGGQRIAYPLTPARRNLAFVDAIRDALDAPREAAPAA